MYFLPRNNALYSRIVYIKPAYRYALTSVVILVIGGAWFFMVHGLLLEHNVHMKAEIKRLHEQERMIKQSTIDITRLEQSIAQTQTKLSSYTHKKNSYDVLQSAMMFLVNQAGLCGIAMQSCNVVEQKDETWYTRSTVSLDVQGNFEQLLKFVQSMAASDFILSVHHADISYAASNNFNLRCGLDLIVVL